VVGPWRRAGVNGVGGDSFEPHNSSRQRRWLRVWSGLFQSAHPVLIFCDLRDEDVKRKSTSGENRIVDLIDSRDFDELLVVDVSSEFLFPAA
jgi:hypothetical protein